MTLNLPEKRNAMTPRLTQEFHAAIDQVRGDPAVRVLILAATGPVFCAGGDLETLREGLDRSPEQNRQYQSKFYRDFLTILHTEVPRVEYDKLTSERLGETSAQIRERVERARKRQRERFAELHLQCNGDMGPAEVRQFCEIDQTGKNLLRSAMQQMQMSARAFHRILKLARTIADCPTIQTPHLAEAIQYRPRRMV